MPFEDDEIRMTLRIPAALRDRLRDAGAASKRSVNGEIVHRLEMTFSDDDAEPMPSASIAHVPDGVSDDDLVAALEEGFRKAREETFRRLGIVEREVKPKAQK